MKLNLYKVLITLANTRQNFFHPLLIMRPSLQAQLPLDVRDPVGVVEMVMVMIVGPLGEGERVVQHATCCALFWHISHDGDYG